MHRSGRRRLAEQTKLLVRVGSPRCSRSCQGGASSSRVKGRDEKLPGVVCGISYEIQTDRDQIQRWVAAAPRVDEPPWRIFPAPLLNAEEEHKRHTFHSSLPEHAEA